MKTEEMNENCRKIKGSHFQNYSYLSSSSDSYLSFQWSNSSKFGTISNSIILSRLSKRKKV